MGDIATVEALEERIGKAPALVHLKSIDHLDSGALGWVAASPLMIAGFADGAWIRTSLGGGEPGWATGDTHELRLPTSKLDDPALARPGASFGSIFLIPSISEILRINGKVVAISEDMVRIAVEECYFHCGKALIRSDFWAVAPGRAGPDDPAAFARDGRFLGLATVDMEGRADLSPKGDPAGAMTHLVGDALLFADRPGNKRIDSFRNIVTQPHVAATIIIPGSTKVACLSGTASITADEEMRTAFTVNEKTPKLVTRIEGVAVEIHDSPTLARARLWPAPPAPAHIDPGKIVIGHMKLGKSMGAKLAGTMMSVPGLMKRELAKDYKKHLY